MFAGSCLGERNWPNVQPNQNRLRIRDRNPITSVKIYMGRYIGELELMGG
jgi:hypothetical protein